MSVGVTDSSPQPPREEDSGDRAITLWETEAEVAAGEVSGGYYGEQLAKMALLFASAPIREAYKVTAQV